MNQTEPIAACLGDACIDVYVPPNEGKYFGGNAVNTAVALSAAGAPAAYIGAVGSDAEGRGLLAALAARGVDTSRAQVLDGPTNRSHTRLHAGGTPEFVHALNPPRLAFKLSEETTRWLAGRRLVAANWLWDAAEVFAALREAGAQGGRPLLAMDYGGRMAEESMARTAHLADAAFISLSAERAGEAREHLARLAGRGPGLVVALLGAAGSLAFDGDWHACPAEPVEVLDSLGAGDAYTGAFLAARLRGEPVAESMAAGARAAARTCRLHGGWEGAAF